MTEISTDWKSILLVEYSKNTFTCLVYYKDKIYLVPESKLKEKILRAIHDAPLAGHQGYLKTYRQVRERSS
jgi:hypothetical protein